MKPLVALCAAFRERGVVNKDASAELDRQDFARPRPFAGSLQPAGSAAPRCLTQSPAAHVAHRGLDGRSPACLRTVALAF